MLNRHDSRENIAVGTSVRGCSPYSPSTKHPLCCHPSSPQEASWWKWGMPDSRWPAFSSTSWRQRTTRWRVGDHGIEEKNGMKWSDVLGGWDFQANYPIGLAIMLLWSQTPSNLGETNLKPATEDQVIERYFSWPTITSDPLIISTICRNWYNFFCQPWLLG